MPRCVTIGLYAPRGKGVTINLAPADIRKEGTAYDLPLAVGLLAATEQVPAEMLEHYLVMGELSLDGGCARSKEPCPLPRSQAARLQGRHPACRQCAGGRHRARPHRHTVSST